MKECFKRTCSPQAILGDLKNPVFWRDVVVESIATMILVTCVLLVVTTNNPEAYKPSTTHIGVAAAFIIFMIVEGFGPICGAHLNPAVSIPMFIAGRITLTRALAYTGAQILGSLMAVGIIVTVSPLQALAQYHPLLPARTMTPTQAILIEAFFTFLLLFTAMSVTDPRVHPVPHLPGLVIGCTVGLCALVGGTHSGAALNPVISLAPAVITGKFIGHSIYWIGPMLGGTIGVLLYNLIQFIKFKFTPRPTPAPANPEGLAKAEEAEALAKREELIRLLEDILNRPIIPIKTSDL